MGWFAFIDALIIFRDPLTPEKEQEIRDIFIRLSHGQKDRINYEDRDINGTVRRCLDIHFSFDYNRRQMLNIMHKIKHMAILENGTYFEFFDVDDDTWSFTFMDGKFIEAGN